MTPLATEARLRERGIVLPAPEGPSANYVLHTRVGSLLYLAGHGPLVDGAPSARGKLGREFGVEEGYRIAREVGLIMLTTVRDAVGSLDRVRRVVKVLGMVASAEGFTEQPAVINGFSDLMVEVVGEAGRHARSAVGLAELPMGIPIEIEAIFDVD